MKKLFLLIAMLCTLHLAAEPYQQNLTKQTDGWTLPRNGKWLNDNSLEINISRTAGWRREMNTAVFRLPVERLRGKAIRLSGEAMAEKLNIEERRQPYFGFKFMLVITSPRNTLYPAATSGNRSGFPWKKFLIETDIPEDATKLEFHAGLQDISGKVLFRNLKAEELHPLYAAPRYAAPYKLPDNFRCQYTDDIRNRPMFRGVMSPIIPKHKCSVKDLEDLASWGANLVRWQINHPRDKTILADPTRFEAWYEERLNELDKLMPHFERLGLHVIIDMHTPPGGRYKDAAGPLPEEISNGDPAFYSRQFRMFYEDRYLESFLKLWCRIAERFKNRNMIWGYDLCNEPWQRGSVRNNYLKCQYLAAKEIRKIDPHTPIIVESNTMCLPADFCYLKPLPFTNVIYQIHVYMPTRYTHQGVSPESMEQLRQGKFIRYPDCIGGLDGLRKEVTQTRLFEKKYGAVIYCGEFSAIRWAPGAAEYMRDVIKLCEEYQWSWTYHAYREWHGWSVEHSSDLNDNRPVSQDTDRKKVLLEGFRKNRQ